MTMIGNGGEEFDAFISYRRKDAHAVAAWLYRALREYRLPPELRGGRREPLRVYMDVLFESATEDFWSDTVRPHLLASRRLIVVSSPSSLEMLPDGRPNWLMREIETYVAERPDPKVSVVVGRGAFDTPLPAGLHLRHPNIERVDLRASGLGRWFRPSVRRRLHGGLLTLVAALQQVSDAEMLALRRWDELQLQRRRFLAVLALTVVLAMVVLAVGLAAVAAASQRKEAVAAATLRGRAIYDERPGEARLQFAAAVVHASRWWPPFARQTAADARAWLAQRYEPSPNVFINAYDWDPDQVDVPGDRLLLREGSRLSVARISTGRFETRAVACNDATEGGWIQEARWILVPGSLDGRTPACVMGMDGRIIHSRLPPMPRPETVSLRTGLAALVGSTGSMRRVQLWSLTTSKPIGSALERQSTSIVVRFSPGGKWLVVCDDREISLLDDTGTPRVREPSGGRCESDRSRFSPNDTRWIVASRGMLLKVFEPTTGRAEMQIRLAGDGRWVLDATGRFLAAEAEGNGVEVWDLDEPRRLYTVPPSASARPDRLAFLPGHAPKLAVLDDWRLQLWVSGERVANWSSPPNMSATAYEMRVSTDGSRLGARGDRFVVVWSTDGQRPPSVVRHAEEVTDFDFDSAGRFLATASRDGFGRIWQSADGAPFGDPLEHRAAVEGIRFLADGNHVATWAGPVLRVWPLVEPHTPLHVPGSSSNISVSPNGGPTALASVSEFGDGRLFDVAGEEIRRFRHDGCGPPAGRSQEEAISAAADRFVRTLYRGSMTGAYSADGRLLATWKCDNTAIVWDVSTGQQIGAPLAHDARVEALALGRSGRQALTGAADGSAQLWRLPEGSRIGPTVRQGEMIVAAALSPDESLAATATISGVRVWRTTTTATLFESAADGGFIEALEFSGDGKRLLIQSAGEVEMFDLGRLPHLLFRLEIPGATAAHFDAAGLRFVVASTDNTARLFDARTGGPVGAPMVHQSDVADARFGLAETRVVTAAGNSVQVWDALDGTPVGRAMKHAAACTTATFSADGAALVTLCGDAVHIWPWRIDASSADGIMERAEVSTGFKRDPSTESVRLLTAYEWSARLARQSGK
jgi:WD40 repeat protein